MIKAYFSRSCSRTFYMPKICNTERVNNCSFQLPYYVYPAKCFIYNACNNLNVFPWDLQPLTTSISESDSPISITIVPYAVYKYEIHKHHPVSAINISIIVRNQGINGFFMNMIKYDSSKNICRIFDFRNASNSLQYPVTFYYDCFFNFVETISENITMTFRAYPMNIELSYFIKIPPIPLKNFKSVCDWKPLVMIFQGSLPKFHVVLKFSTSPNETDIFFYVVTLTDFSAKEIQSNKIPSRNNKADMITSEFVAVKSGFYSISINIILSKDNSCLVSETEFFFVGNHTKDYSIITLLIAVIICASILLCCCQHHYHSASNLLFVYSYDCSQHTKFLLTYIKYLPRSYTINTIYFNEGLSNSPVDISDPNLWIDNVYRKSNVIIFVISEGLFHTFDRNNTPLLEEGYPWKGQLETAVKRMEIYFKNIADDKKKICKVCFPYSKVEYIPERLKLKGKCFMLPKEEESFFRFISGFSRYFFSERLHKLFGHNLKILNNEEVKDCLQNMIDCVAKKKHVLYSNWENNENSISTLECTRKIKLANTLEDIPMYEKDSDIEFVFSEQDILFGDIIASEVHTIFHK